MNNSNIAISNLSRKAKVYFTLGVICAFFFSAGYFQPPETFYLLQIVVMAVALIYLFVQWNVNPNTPQRDEYSLAIDNKAKIAALYAILCPVVATVVLGAFTPTTEQLSFLILACGSLSYAISVFSALSNDGDEDNSSVESILKQGYLYGCGALFTFGLVMLLSKAATFPELESRGLLWSLSLVIAVIAYLIPFALFIKSCGIFMNLKDVGTSYTQEIKKRSKLKWQIGFRTALAILASLLCLGLNHLTQSFAISDYMAAFQALLCFFIGLSGLSLLVKGTFEDDYLFVDDATETACVDGNKQVS